MKKFLIAAVLMAVAGGAYAGSALEQLKTADNATGQQLPAASVNAVPPESIVTDKMSPEPLLPPMVEGPKIPQHPKDAFGLEETVEECGFVTPYSEASDPTDTSIALDEVIDGLRLCAKAVSKRYGVTVLPSKAIFSGNRPGILLTVMGPIPTGNSVLMDIRYALELREGKLLGYPALELMK
jgi:hypothetical protein